MEIKQLEYFVEIVDCGTFSSAAEKIFVTQPALSKIIKKLETELGTALLYSQGKTTVPTDSGKILYEQAKKILYECQVTVERIEDLKGNPSGFLRISTPGSWNRMPQIYSLITDFIHKYPQITLDVLQMDSASYKEKLTTGATDIAFVCGTRPEDPQFESLSLIRDSYHFAFPRELSLASHERISWSDILELPLALLTRTYQLYQTTLREFHKRGASPHIRMTSDQINLILDVITQNRWCTILGEPLSEEDHKKYPDLISIPMDASNEFCMLRRKEGYASTAEQCFVQFVKNAWKKEP